MRAMWHWQQTWPIVPPGLWVPKCGGPFYLLSPVPWISVSGYTTSLPGGYSCRRPALIALETEHELGNSAQLCKLRRQRYAGLSHAICAHQSQWIQS